MNEQFLIAEAMQTLCQDARYRFGENQEIIWMDERSQPEKTELDAALLVVKERRAAQQARQMVRSAIADKAGDTDSLLGTTADATQFLLYATATLVSKLSAAQSLAEVRAATAPFADVFTAFLTRVEGGEVVLPFQIKGLEAAVSEIEQRATAVAEVLQTSSTKEQTPAEAEVLQTTTNGGN